MANGALRPDMVGCLFLWIKFYVTQPFLFVHTCQWLFLCNKTGWVDFFLQQWSCNRYTVASGARNLKYLFFFFFIENPCWPGTEEGLGVWTVTQTGWVRFQLDMDTRSGSSSESQFLTCKMAESNSFILRITVISMIVHLQHVGWHMVSNNKMPAIIRIFFRGTGAWTQGLVLAWQMLYHLSL
jgi:hypothetical protein